MNNKRLQSIICCNEKSFELLHLLESIIKVTYTTCQNNEDNSIYYNIPFDKRIKISNERSNYINMMLIALEKISSLYNLNEVIEKELIDYNNTPTIAADK